MYKLSVQMGGFCVYPSNIIASHVVLKIGEYHSDVPWRIFSYVMCLNQYHTSKIFFMDFNV